MHKMCLLAVKRQLRPGMRVLDIGGGCGGLAVFFAVVFGVSVDTVTLSKDQADIAEMTVDLNGVADKVRVFRCHYSELHGQYDLIVSVGALEHFGREHYAEFFEVSHASLAPGGSIILHFIWARPGLDRLAGVTNATNEWINVYPFPGGDIPTKSLITKAMEGRFVAADWHDFYRRPKGLDAFMSRSRPIHDYARTNLAWDDNMTRARPKLEDKRMPDGRVFDDQFFLTDHYARHLFAALFESRAITVGQVHLFRPGEIPKSYTAVR